MSQRLGMADGRCFTISTSSQLFNNFVMQQNKIDLEDNYSYRQFLQKTGPDILKDFTNDVPCDKPLLKIPGIY